MDFRNLQFHENLEAIAKVGFKTIKFSKEIEFLIKSDTKKVQFSGSVVPSCGYWSITIKRCIVIVIT